MKKNLILGLICGLLAACSQGGGSGSGAPNATDAFSRLDADQSGAVSYSEFNQAPKPRGGLGGGQGASTEEMKRKRFARMDTNSDSQISLAEFQAQRGSRGQGRRLQGGARF